MRQQFYNYRTEVFLLEYGIQLLHDKWGENPRNSNHLTEF